MVGHSGWSGPRLYQYDLAKELESTVRPVVVVPSESRRTRAEALTSPDHGLVSVAMGPDRRVVLSGEAPGPPANVNRAWKGKTETLREPPSVQRKTVSTPRSGGEGSPPKPEP